MPGGSPGTPQTRGYSTQASCSASRGTVAPRSGQDFLNRALSTADGGGALGDRRHLDKVRDRTAAAANLDDAIAEARRHPAPLTGPPANRGTARADPAR